MPQPSTNTGRITLKFDIKVSADCAGLEYYSEITHSGEPQPVFDTQSTTLSRGDLYLRLQEFMNNKLMQTLNQLNRKGK